MTATTFCTLYPDDPQQQTPAGWCALCGGELYPDSPAETADGVLLCPDCAQESAPSTPEGGIDP